MFAPKKGKIVHGLVNREKLIDRSLFFDVALTRRFFRVMADLSLAEKGAPRQARLVLTNSSHLVSENKKASTIAASCVDWFNRHPRALETFVRTLRRQENFSLRIIDWTTTNYSKRHRITIFHNGLPIDLHNDYRRHLGVFTKKYFDPFARRERLLIVVHPPDESLSTTVGQLNFMKWMLERDLHLRVQELRKDIELDMREYDGKRKEEKEKPKPERHSFMYTGPFRLLF
jgi:hypothetical protein